jgi:hypothetical protein
MNIVTLASKRRYEYTFPAAAGLGFLLMNEEMTNSLPFKYNAHVAVSGRYKASVFLCVTSLPH